MKILYFCQLFPPALHGGGEYIFFQWAKELIRRGHKVFVVTQRLKGVKDFEYINSISVYRVGPATEYKGTLPPGLFENLGYVISAFVKGMAIIAKNGIDIIHSNTYAPALPGQLCAITSRKSHIITFHDVYFLTERRFWKKWASQRNISHSITVVGPFVERLILRFPAKVFHTVSETSKKDLSMCGVKKILVIPNGINLGDYDATSSNNVNTHQAVYIGRLVFYKNIDIVIRAMEKVVKKIPDAQFVIVGDGPYRKNLEGLVKDLKLMNNIIFTGRISHNEKVKLLNESSFLILPSLVEGFGIVILEAYACKKPVLTSNVMPLPEIVEDGRTGFTAPPFDSDVWTEKIIYLFENPPQAQEMGIKGYENLMQRYLIERVVDELEKLYIYLLRANR
jgi:glycosyltransferase involved in cell wall biosynthesis